MGGKFLNYLEKCNSRPTERCVLITIELTEPHDIYSGSIFTIFTMYKYLLWHLKKLIFRGRFKIKVGVFSFYTEGIKTTFTLLFHILNSIKFFFE